MCKFVFVLAAALCVLLSHARADQILVTSYSSNRVSRFDLPSGAFLGTLDLAANLSGPLCTRMGPDGRLYVASELTQSIVRCDPQTGAYIDTFITAGAGGLTSPAGLTWGPDGNLYVPDFNTSSVLRFNSTTGAYMDTPVPSGAGGLNGADNGTIFGPDGSLYVPSYFGNRIMKYAAGTFTPSIFVNTISRPRVLEFRAGVLYVTTETGDTVLRYNATSGAAMGSLMLAGAGGLDLPIGFAWGNDGFAYVASATRNNVLRFNTNGTFSGIQIAAGAGGISAPTFLTIIPAPGAGVTLCVAVAVISRRRRRN